jgi:hypothetical protein
LQQEGVLNLLTHVCDNWNVDGEPTNNVMIFGELFGPEGLDWRVFDISVNGTYLGRADLILLCLAFGVQMVPALYTGPFSPELVEQFTEVGIVITPLVEQQCSIGRLILKSVK